MRVRFTPNAWGQIDEIERYLLGESPLAARRFVNRVEEMAQAIAAHPELGVMTSSPPMRRVQLRPFPHLVFYEPHSQGLAVIGVLHGARDPGSMPDAR